MIDLPSCHAPKNYDHLQWNENRSSDSILLPQSPFQQKGSSNAFMPENEFENKPFNELIPDHDARKKNNKDIKNRNNDESITNSKNISTKGRFKISRSPHRFSIQVLSRNSDNSSFKDKLR